MKNFKPLRLCLSALLGGFVFSAAAQYNELFIINGDSLYSFHNPGRTGLISRDGREVFPPVLIDFYQTRVEGDVVVTTDRQQFYMGDGKLQGIITRDLEVIVPMQYSQVLETKHGHWLCDSVGYKVLYNRAGRRMAGPCLSIAEERAGYGLVSAEGLVKIDTSGQVIASRYPWKMDEEYPADNSSAGMPQHDTLQLTEDIAAFRKNGKWGLMTTGGRLLVAPEFDAVWAEGNFAVVRKQELTSLINREGKVLLPPAEQQISYPGRQAGYYIKNQLVGFLDGEGKVVHESDIKYDLEPRFEDGFWQVSGGDKMRLYTARGKQILPECTTFYVDENGKIHGYDGSWKLYDTEGQPVSAAYDNISWTGAAYVVGSPGGFGLLNRAGKELVPAEMMDIRVRRDSTFELLNHEEKVGIINNRGEWIIPFGLDGIWETVIQGKLQISRENRYGLLDSNYRELIPAENKELVALQNGTFFASSPDGYFLYDINGKQLRQLQVDSATAAYAPDGTYFILLEKGGKKGIITASGWESQISFEHVADVQRGHLMLRRNGKDIALNLATGREMDLQDFIIQQDRAIFYEIDGVSYNAHISSFVDGLYFEMLNLGPSNITAFVVNDQGRVIWRNRIREIEYMNPYSPPELIRHLSELEDVVFYGNDWNYGFTLPDEFFDLPSLRRLSITNSDLDSVPDAIGGLRTLEELHLQVLGCGYISPRLVHLPVLKRVSIVLDDHRELTIPENLAVRFLHTNLVLPQELPVIDSLEIWLDEGEQEIPAVVKGYSTLRYLAVGGNVDFNTIFQPVLQQPGLEEISIINEVQLEEVRGLVEALPGSQIKRVTLRGYISDEELEPYRRKLPGVKVQVTLPSY